MTSIRTAAGPLTRLRSEAASLYTSRLPGVLAWIGTPLLRGSLAVVYIWFGALKVSGATPVAGLVAGTVPWLDPTWFVPALGAIEIVLGAALATRRLTLLTGLLICGHLAGTFLVFAMQPAVAFQGQNPLLLTTTGEFVVKNLVLASAALVLVGVPPGPPRPGGERPLPRQS